MMIDYVTVMLINMAAGLFMAALFFLGGLGREDCRYWAAPFAIVGLVALATGLDMIFAWPLAKYPWANSTHGEMSVLLGALFLGGALAVGMRWPLAPLGIYAAFGGVAAIVLGVGIVALKLTPSPLLSGGGFILTGAAGVLALPTAYWKALPLRVASATLLIGAALLWAFIGYAAYWAHLADWSKH